MGKKTIQIFNSIVNFIITIIIVMLLAFAGYALWDSKQIYGTADKSIYAVYKPTVENEGISFMELQALNPEVFSWLTVYGTNIDYPVTQGSDNMKYVSTNAEGLYSLSGSIFLDCQNSKDFSDFNSILYGHHMEHKAMFGEIGYFSDRNIFDAHRYGNLYFDGKDHGIEFFAFIHTDAYDGLVFTANIREEEMRQLLLDDLMEKAMYKRDIGVTIGDRIVLFTTCSSASTNGRDILAGKVTDETYDDPFTNAEPNDGIGQPDTGVQSGFVKEAPVWPLLLILILILARLIKYALVKYYENKQNRIEQCKEV